MCLQLGCCAFYINLSSNKPPASAAQSMLIVSCGEMLCLMLRDAYTRRGMRFMRRKPAVRQVGCVRQNMGVGSLVQASRQRPALWKLEQVACWPLTALVFMARPAKLQKRNRRLYHTQCQAPAELYTRPPGTLSKVIVTAPRCMYLCCTVRNKASL